MKLGLGETVGKTIAAVIVAKGKRPRNQVFLVFTDGSSLELYGEDFTCCAGLDAAERIERYVMSNGGEIVHVYGEAVEAAGPPRPISTWTPPASYQERSLIDLRQEFGIRVI